MAKDLDRAVDSAHFTSAARVHDSEDRPNSLVAQIRALLVHLNQGSVAGASVGALTDMSGGTAGATYEIANSGVLSDNDLTGMTTGVQSLALNAAADTYMNAYRELADQLNDVWAGIGAGVGTVDEGPGAAPDDTIDAITTSVTANTGNTDAATTASARDVQADLLHAQAVLIHALDDAREAVGLDRSLVDGPGRFAVGSGETLVFADANPDTLTRDVGSWVDDGFRVGDTIEIKGTQDNNVEARGDRLTIASLTATVLTFDAGDAVTAESLTAAETALVTIKTVNQAEFPGRFPGAGAGPDLDETAAQPAAGGGDWTLSFQTGTSAISDAVDGADATSAVLKTEVDAFLAELANNIAFINDRFDEVRTVTQSGVGYAAMSGNG